ncbi:MAG: hypothetical protein QE271_04830 [Bacteriovoracaceae bacterium]|nr:hypothetical protein [Bacteriovoracaceae bacterium]
MLIYKYIILVILVISKYVYCIPLDNWNQLRGKEKVAIYFGTFDPFTLGHQHIVEYALTIGFDAVLILPGSRNYSKVPAPFNIRADLIHSVFEANESVFYPYRGDVLESYLKNPDSTRFLFNQFVANSAKQVAVLMGSDTVNSEISLLKLSLGGYNPNTFLVFTRDADIIKSSNLNLLRRMNRSVQINKTKFESISSSKVRELLHNNSGIYLDSLSERELNYEKLFKNFLNKNVFMKIIEKGIYLGYPASNKISKTKKAKDLLLSLPPRIVREYLIALSRNRFSKKDYKLPDVIDLQIQNENVQFRMLSQIGNGFNSNAYIPLCQDRCRLHKKQLGGDMGFQNETFTRV